MLDTRKKYLTYQFGSFQCFLGVAILFLGPSRAPLHPVVVLVLAMLALGGPVNEAHGSLDVTIDSGNLASTTDAPGDDSSLSIAKMVVSKIMFLIKDKSFSSYLDINVRVFLKGTNQRSTAVSLACVFVYGSSGAGEAFVQLEEVSEPGAPQLVLAFVLVNHVQWDLLEDLLVLSGLAKPILTPTGGHAVLSPEVVVGGWQADGVDVGGQDEVVLQVDEGEVIVEVAAVVGRVEGHCTGVPILMLKRLDNLSGVPFTATNLQITGLQITGKEMTQNN